MLIAGPEAVKNLLLSMVLPRLKHRVNADRVAVVIKGMLK